jgi:hypothetical protein
MSYATLSNLADLAIGFMKVACERQERLARRELADMAR